MHRNDVKRGRIVYTAPCSETQPIGMTMRSSRRSVLFAVAAASLLASHPRDAGAQSAAGARISDGTVKIGLMLDMSGPLSDTTGGGSAAAAKMAVEDFGGRVLGAPIEVLVADHENSSERAAAIARDWFAHQKVDAIMDVTGSPEALAVQGIASSRDKIISLSSAAAERLSNEACTSTSIHYVADTHSIAHTIGSALMERGDNTWFFITVDNSFGYDLERGIASVVEAMHGTVLGHARHPLDTQDFTSYLAQASHSRAKVIGLVNGGADVAATIRQAAEREMIPGPQLFAAPVMRINQVHALGLATTQGMMLSESFYWDMSEAARTWSMRFYDRTQKMPNGSQAGVYSSTLHYLRAVAHAGTDATGPVMQAMRDTPVDDFFAHNGHIRADGVMVHDLRLYQVKTPAESHEPWDYFKLVATIPGEEAVTPLAESKCPLIKP